MSESRKNYTEALQAIFDYVQPTPEEIMSMSIEEVRKELSEDGFDVSSRLEIARLRFDVFCTRKKLDSAKAKRKKIEKKYFINSKQTSLNIPNIREALMNYLSTISSDRRQLITAHFRNFENITDDDLKTLFDDLKLLEQIQNEETGPHES